MRFKWRPFVKIFILLTFTFIYCEYFNYYIVISQCSWPEFQDEINEKNQTYLKAMFLADTHLLGPFRGHWFDKLRREWQMYRAFQSAVSLYNPEVVFILGDLFDEGQWCSRDQLQTYFNRFTSLFEVSSSTKMHIVPGNHDVGFHYAIRPYLLYRFEELFNISSVQFLNIKGNYFVSINSMALEGDGCFLCSSAEKKIKSIAAKLKCLKEKNCKEKSKLKEYSRPIILQHFPMYRKSDSECNERDEAPSDIKNTLFREKWDCLSQKASEMILKEPEDASLNKLWLEKIEKITEKGNYNETKLFSFFLILVFIYPEIYDDLDPRLIITGHTHHGCHLVHRKDIHEYTLPSFSWRNKNNPTFMLAKISPTNHTVAKCDIPEETTVIFIYSVVVLTITVCVVYTLLHQQPKLKCL